MPTPPVNARRRARWLAVGCIAGMAIATAGSWIRFALERSLRIDTSTTAYLIGSAISGTGLLVTGLCSLALARQAQHLTWRTLAASAIVLQLASLPALPLTSSDAFANLAFGELFRAGLSPYLHSPAELAGSPLVPLVAPRWVRDPTPYGPLFHPFAAAASRVGDALGPSPWGALYAYKLLLLGALGGALVLAARQVRARSDADGRDTWTSIAFGPLLAWEITAQGHNDGLLVLALVAFVTFASARRDAGAIAAVAAGAAVKYALAPLVALFALLRARASLRRGFALAIVALGVVALAFVPEWRSTTLRSVLPMVGGETARHAHSFTDLVCMVLDHLDLPRASAAAYRTLSTASALVCAAYLLRAAWRSQTVERLAHEYLLFLIALYLTAPWFQPWYVSWALPLLLVEPDARWRRLFATFSVVTVVQWIVPLDPVTTVAGNLWLVWHAWRLREVAPAVAVAP